MSYYEYEREDQVRNNLKRLLSKLGLKSAVPTLTEEDLRRMIAQAQNNFGMPDELIMSQRMFDDLKKLLK